MFKLSIKLNLLLYRDASVAIYQYVYTTYCATLVCMKGVVFKAPHLFFKAITTISLLSCQNFNLTYVCVLWRL